MCYKVDDDPEKNFQGIKIAVYIVNPINNLFELHFSNNALICPKFHLGKQLTDQLSHKSIELQCGGDRGYIYGIYGERICYQICG